jgi:hypothetical protein
MFRKLVLLILVHITPILHIHLPQVNTIWCEMFSQVKSH